MAMDLRHPYTMAYALYHTGFLHLLRQEPEPMRDRGVGVLDVADEYELPIWRALGTVLLGAAKTDMGHFDEGLAEIADGVAQYQGLRSPPVFWPLLMFVRARACARAGRPAEGLEFIDQSLGISRCAGILPPLFFAMKGDLLLALPERGCRRVVPARFRRRRGAGRQDAAAASRGRAVPGAADRRTELCARSMRRSRRASRRPI